jgi:phosphinothricin acetyltransferase
MNIRDAAKVDLPAIVDIYNAAIPTRIATADLEPVTVESRQAWFAEHNSQSRPLWVLEIDRPRKAGSVSREIIAWISLNSFYGGRPAYNATAEVSIYIHPEHQGKGYGTQLVRRIIEHSPCLGVTTLLAVYFDHNTASRCLFEKLGFEPMGHLTEIAVLEGIKRGVIIAARRV